MIAPEPILKAGNDTVSNACIWVRFHTYREGLPMRMINEIMDAIHEVPRMLIDWRPDSLEFLRSHLACFNLARWPEGPNLLMYFETRLKHYGFEETRSGGNIQA